MEGTYCIFCCKGTYCTEHHTRGCSFLRVRTATHTLLHTMNTTRINATRSLQTNRHRWNHKFNRVKHIHTSHIATLSSALRMLACNFAFVIAWGALLIAMTRSSADMTAEQGSFTFLFARMSHGLHDEQLRRREWHALHCEKCN